MAVYGGIIQGIRLMYRRKSHFLCTIIEADIIAANNVEMQLSKAQKKLIRRERDRPESESAEM